MRNHLRLLAGVVGVCYLLVPRQTIAALTRVAYSDGADAEPREWVYAAARVEGAVLTLFALRSLFRAAEADGTVGAEARGRELPLVGSRENDEA